ncbi:Wzz/FepE/Etk N-terminal domain-containing protein, partial [Thermodesulfatator indicus]
MSEGKSQKEKLDPIHQQLPPCQPYPPPYYEEDEIDLYELWLVLKKRKNLILGLTFGLAFLVAIYSLTMTNLYRSKAVILPMGEQSSSSLLSQFGGLAQIAGISLPTSSSSAEIKALLNSDILKEETIKKYNLLPILLYSQWDEERQTWKKESSPIKNAILSFKTKLVALFQHEKISVKEKEFPDINDGIRAFDDMLNISDDKKTGTITVSVTHPEPEKAKFLVECLLKTLKEHMTREAINLSEKNIQVIKKELKRTSDPTIQQKLYSLMAKQIETITTAKVSENFAFKIIDPPRVPDKKYK